MNGPVYRDTYKDMRLFNDNLTNTQATIQANNNLWIQKDAVGNKGVKVENRSGTIKTTAGDLVIRTGQLDNVRDTFIMQEKEILPDSASINPYIGITYILRPPLPGTPTPLIFRGEFDATISKKWFGHVDLYKNNKLNTSTTSVVNAVASPLSEISSGKDLYINSGILNNVSSAISAKNNVIMTGGVLQNKSMLTFLVDSCDVLKLNQIVSIPNFFV